MNIGNHEPNSSSITDSKVAESSSEGPGKVDMRTVNMKDEACTTTKKETNTSTTTNKRPATKTVRFLSTCALCKQSDDSFFFTPSSKQGLFVFVVFVLGIYTGISYVGWVQDKYGFGRDPAMERKCLPYGPNTHQQTLSMLLKAKGDMSRSLPLTSPRKKKILLNQDNPNPQKPLLPTLFGLEYNHLVAVPVDNATPNNLESSTTIQVSPSWYSLAFNKEVSLAPAERDMIQSTAAKVHQNIPDLETRALQVAWGGPHTNAPPETSWWSPRQQQPNHPNDLSTLDGGHLLYAYLYIMKWNPHPHFPFRLCGDKGCPPERAISHSLQWREAYQPWLVPPSLLQENADGYVYHRGFGPSYDETGGDKHATVWLRLGHKVQNDLAFFRGILNAADRAIATSLVESQGQTGKFNVVMDCAGFALSNTPTLHALKQGVTMLQDHYPNRLGMIFLVHLSRPGEVFLKVVLSLITKEVRDKIKILPNHDKPKSMAILRSVVEEETIPDWLGGTDTYRFNVEDYYPPDYRCTEEQGSEFLTTMPYHAK